MRHYAKKDLSQKPITDDLRARGYRIFDTSKHGEGFPDAVICLRNGRVALLFEFKNETGGTFTADECKFVMKIVEPVYRMATNAEQVDAILKSVEMGI